MAIKCVTQVHVPYVDLLNCRSDRSTMTKLRLSAHKLIMKKVDMLISLDRTGSAMFAVQHQWRMKSTSCLNVQHTAEREKIFS